MRTGFINLAALGLMLGLIAESAMSQGPVASISFRNDTKTQVIVQGTSNVGGLIRRAQPVVIAAGKAGSDLNVPAGPRVYSVYDANQPSKVLAKDVPLVIPAGANLLISVRLLPNNQVGLVPEARLP